MPPAVIAGGIAAVGTIGGAVLSSKAQKSAAKTAANAETQAAQANIAASREFYNRNTQNLSPWLQSGTRANALVDSFLYGSAPTSYYAQPGQPAPAPQPAPQPANAMMLEESSGLREMLPYWREADMPQLQQSGIIGRMLPYRMIPEGTGTNLGTVTTQVPQAAPQPAANAMSGYQAFVNSPYYQFPLQEGYRALNHGLASRGMLESGDAMKAITRYGQDYGYGRMGEFIGLAQSQSDQGLRAGSAIAGVGLNALNTTTAANSAVGSAAANRAIAGGVANANMYSGIGSALGQFAGSVLGPRSSYGSQYGMYPTSGAIGM